jgi:nicotinate-nucleotide adenylyltransferase
VLGGTFDPVHNGHLALAQAARKQLGLGRLIYVPAGLPWRKSGRKITPAPQRLQMLSLAVKGRPGTEISPIEVERRGPSYTAETLAVLARDHPGAELYFIVGEDALADLPHWRQPREILALAKLAVARRRVGEKPSGEWKEMPGIQERVVWLDMAPVEISASEVRRRVRHGEPISAMVPPAVEAYIEQQGLYRDR